MVIATKEKVIRSMHEGINAGAQDKDSGVRQTRRGSQFCLESFCV